MPTTPATAVGSAAHLPAAFNIVGESSNVSFVPQPLEEGLICDPLSSNTQLLVMASGEKVRHCRWLFAVKQAVQSATRRAAALWCQREAFGCEWDSALVHMLRVRPARAVFPFLCGSALGLAVEMPWVSLHAHTMLVLNRIGGPGAAALFFVALWSATVGVCVFEAWPGAVLNWVLHRHLAVVLGTAGR